jgi:hypothetical protein
MSINPTPTEDFTDVTTKHFSGGRNLHGQGDDELGHVLRHQRARHRGVIPSARLAFTANPSNNDTIAWGGHTFKFVAALGVAVVQTQVKILGSAALTLAALIDAINGKTNANVVKGTTPFTGKVVADAVTATVLRVRKALTQGGRAVAGESTTTALTASITAGAAAWDVADLNETGRKMTRQDYAVIKFTVSAAVKTNASKAVELPFTPTEVVAVGNNPQAAFSISGNAVVVAMDDGAGNDYFVATDVVRAIAFA